MNLLSTPTVSVILVLMLALQRQCRSQDGTRVLAVVSGCPVCAVSLSVCDNSDGCLVAQSLFEYMLIRSSTVWRLPFTLL